MLNKRRLTHSNPSLSPRNTIRRTVGPHQEAHIFAVDDLESTHSSTYDGYTDDNDYEEEKTRSTNLHIFKQVVEALLHIHEQQVVHRDIKPDNIFIQENMHVLVGDFGLAKSLSGHAISPEAAAAATTATATPHFENKETSIQASTDEGTYFYMAPELLDRQVYTSKSDIYSLGILLFELFHTFGTEMERILSLTDIKKNPLSLSHSFLAKGIPVDVSNMIVRLLAMDPVSRPTALEILLD
ncbi:kinase-like domain-containing protein, partial [Obelidium mucronatum]